MRSHDWGLPKAVWSGWTKYVNTLMGTPWEKGISPEETDITIARHYKWCLTTALSRSDHPFNIGVWIRPKSA
jgi:hypothetical protein